jgi:hypothetical protein
VLSLKPTVAVLAAILMCAVLMASGNKKPVYPPGGKPGGSWTHGIAVGDTL